MGALGAILSHPLWAVCSLVLAVALWARRWWRWSPGSCPVDLSGKTAIVTGANSGIGKFVALDLARRNARTILACRSPERGRAALEEIRKATGNPQVQLSILDTSSMASVRDFARRFLEEEKRLDILVNNAGATGLPQTVTAEGLELTFATNFLGPFLLTNLLLDAMKAAAPARIVNVSSYMHYWGKLDVKFLTGEKCLKNRSQVYNSTKLMNVVFTVELARRLQGTGFIESVSERLVKSDVAESTFGQGSPKAFLRRLHNQRLLNIPVAVLGSKRNSSYGGIGQCSPSRRHPDRDHAQLHLVAPLALHHLWLPFSEGAQRRSHQHPLLRRLQGSGGHFRQVLRQRLQPGLAPGPGRGPGRGVQALGGLREAHRPGRRKGAAGGGQISPTHPKPQDHGKPVRVLRGPQGRRGIFWAGWFTGHLHSVSDLVQPQDKPIIGFCRQISLE